MTRRHDLESPVLVSACLLGVRCRFDGGTKPDARVLALAERRGVLPICPEQLGGLPTPRVRHERVGMRVVSETGADATEAFERGAIEAIRLAEIVGARRAVLKARSPSCGVGQIYDGTFQGRVMPGDGVLAERLRAMGFELGTEDDVESLG
jgi:uncharacterized protein YbbK (DUF523 family)